jgi:hypothetical protein
MLTKIDPNKVPMKVGMIRTKTFNDGSFSLTKPHAVTEKKLDELFVRVNEKKRWKIKDQDPRLSSLDMSLINDRRILNQRLSLQMFFQGRIINIVGKGPSLDKISASDFIQDGSPILCCNESVWAIEELGLRNQVALIQQDRSLAMGCKPNKEDTIAFISRQAYPRCREMPNMYVYVPTQYGTRQGSLTVCCAIGIARRHGAIGFRLYCFDGSMTGDCGYYSKVPYANTRGGRETRFRNHRRKILRQAVELPIEWYMPQ